MVHYPLPKGDIMLSNPRAAKAVIEVVSPFRFLSIVRCGDGSYHEIQASTPLDAIRATHELCGRLGYCVFVEPSKEASRAAAGGDLRRLIARQREARRVARRIEQIRRKHRRTLPMTMEGAA